MTTSCTAWSSVRINCFVLYHEILRNFFHKCRTFQLAAVWHSQTVLHSKAKFVLMDGRPVHASGVIQRNYNSNLCHLDGNIYLFIFLKNHSWVTWTIQHESAGWADNQSSSNRAMQGSFFGKKLLFNLDSWGSAMIRRGSEEIVGCLLMVKIRNKNPKAESFLINQHVLTEMFPHRLVFPIL